MIQVQSIRDIRTANAGPLAANYLLICRWKLTKHTLQYPLSAPHPYLRRMQALDSVESPYEATSRDRACVATVRYQQ